MGLKIYLKITISSILAFALIMAGVGKPTTAFENVLAQGEDSSLQGGNMTGMSQDLNQ